MRRWLPLLPVLAALAVFHPVLGFSFVRWDDGAVLLSNPFLRDGWIWKNLLTSGYPDTYSPLCWLFLYGAVKLAGFRAAVFHFLSLAFHAGTTAVVFFLVREVYRAARPKDGEEARSVAAAFAAALFAVHPVQAEIVAGAAYLTDGPACLLTVLALYFHARGKSRPALLAAAAGGLWRWQAAAVGPLAVILDLWPLRRRARKEEAALLGISLLTAAAHAWAKHRAAGYGAAAPRWGAAALGALHLAASWFWPGRRLPVYVYSGSGTPWGWSPSQAVIFIASLTGLLLLLRRRRPELLATWSAFLVCVAPPLLLTGPLPAYGHDRYLYLAAAGLAALTAAPLLRWKSPGVRSAAVALLVVLGAAARREALAWRDSETLWRRAFALEPESPTFAFRLGETLLLDRGRTEEAVAYFRIQRRREPSAAGRALGHAYDRRASELLRAGRRAAAVAALEEALRCDPGRPDLAANLAAARAARRNGILKTR